MRIAIPALLLSALILPLAGADAPDPSVKLREQLRSTMLQLRTAQTEAANLQAAQAASEAKVKELEAKATALEARNAKLAKERTDDQTAAEKSIANLTNKLAERDKRVAEFEAALEKWKDGYQKAAGIARPKVAERAALADEVVTLKRTVADRETKNLALFNTAMEILDRFEKYALGKALAAREPFIGTTRVKVESLVEGYKDKILEQRIAAPAKKP